MQLIGKILPVDGYVAEMTAALPVDFLQSLTHLYQPLIGPHAVMLYQTLLSECEADKGIVKTHHALMNYTTLPLDEIYVARTKLEAIGLLKTYKAVAENQTVYTYQLECPFSPAAFFREAMLSSLLYHHVGENHFLRLKSLFIKEETPSDRGQDVTADFKDVFEPFKPEPKAMPADFKQTEEKVVKASEEDDPFQWLAQTLKQRMIPVQRVLTTENRKLISQMYQLYDLETFEVERAVQWALTDENELHQEEFKKACHDLFKTKNNNKPIRLVEKQQPAIVKQVQDVPKTKEELLVQELEIISPKQLLEDLSGGNQASAQDMKAVEAVMTSQGLPAPVMNVLIHYVLLQTNMQLSKPYLEKIASHWSRAKLKTAREAMDFAKQEKARFEEAKTKKKTFNRSAAKDIIPEWYEKGVHKQSKPQTEKEDQLSEEQAQIAEMLKRYTEEH